MPLIDLINGFKIFIYNGEHRPAHIHARYNDFEVIITIEAQTVKGGHMPRKQLKLIVDWLNQNQDYARKVFYELNPRLK